MNKPYKNLVVDVRERIATVTFNREKDTNAFSRAMTVELMDVCQFLVEDGKSPNPQLDALILTGGTGRSFSVGGDFNDVSALEEEAEISAYLHEIVDAYVGVLKVDIPVIAAIDKFAIGQGLQVALMTDWRIGSSTCQLQMPELKNGVACPLGSVILEFLLGRARMVELILDCEFLDAERSRSLALLNDVVEAADLQARAFAFAKRLQAFPRTSYVTTKRIQNERFIAAFETVRAAAARSHVDSFLRKTGKKHFEKVLGKVGVDA